MKIIENKFEFRKFIRQYFNEYCNWFKDKELKNTLGYIDEEWLNFILKDEEGIELAVFQDNKLICVIGLNYPDEMNKSYTITNIAVKPNLKNKGIGSEILLELLKKYQLNEDEYWVSFVDLKNKNGQRFFEKNGWMKYIEKDMIKYILLNNNI